jgi:hypothetical protein
MSATVQSKPGKAASVVFSAPAFVQEPLRTEVSDEEFWKERQRKIEEFNSLCEEASRQARANGLTKEILAEILAER